MASLSTLARRHLTACSRSDTFSIVHDENGYEVADVSFVDYDPDVDFARSEMRAAASGKQKIAGFGDEAALWDPKFLDFEARYAAALVEVKIHLPMNAGDALRVCEEITHEIGR